jgi:hypothetical protein
VPAEPTATNSAGRDLSLEFLSPKAAEMELELDEDALEGWGEVIDEVNQVTPSEATRSVVSITPVASMRVMPVEVSDPTLETCFGEYYRHHILRSCGASAWAALHARFSSVPKEELRGKRDAVLKRHNQNGASDPEVVPTARAESKPVMTVDDIRRLSPEELDTASWKPIHERIDERRLSRSVTPASTPSCAGHSSEYTATNSAEVPLSSNWLWARWREICPSSRCSTPRSCSEPPRQSLSDLTSLTAFLGYLSSARDDPASHVETAAQEGYSTVAPEEEQNDQGEEVGTMKASPLAWAPAAAPLVSSLPPPPDFDPPADPVQGEAWRQQIESSVPCLAHLPSLGFDPPTLSHAGPAPSFTPQATVQQAMGLEASKSEVLVGDYMQRRTSDAASALERILRTPQFGHSPMAPSMTPFQPFDFFPGGVPETVLEETEYEEDAPAPVLIEGGEVLVLENAVF